MSNELYMKRTLELANQGLGLVSPNPLVGCVVVHEGKIIGEGWHREYGQAHAEVNAINSVADKALLAECAVYVNLEPCSHFGKTPPCADLLISSKVKKVIVANLDPNPLVAGKGIQKLQEAGIEVETGLLEDQARTLNKRFFTSMEKGRPFVILKWAETADGFIARENFDSKWISGEESRNLVHRWRGEEDAILVGKNTAKHDNPNLTVRGVQGKNPVRIVIDPQLSLSGELNLFTDGEPTICYNLLDSKKENSTEFVAFDLADEFVSNLLTDLHQRGIGSLIVEGGGYTLQQFIDAGLWDEARVFKSQTTFGNGIKAPILNLETKSIVRVFDDKLSIFQNG